MKGILPVLLRALHKADILIEDLHLTYEPDELEGIYRGLCRLPAGTLGRGSAPGKQRRIDFLVTPWECRGAALLYYTVSPKRFTMIRLR